MRKVGSLSTGIIIRRNGNIYNCILRITDEYAHKMHKTTDLIDFFEINILALYILLCSKYTRQHYFEFFNIQFAFAWRMARVILCDDGWLEAGDGQERDLRSIPSNYLVKNSGTIRYFSTRCNWGCGTKRPNILDCGDIFCGTKSTCLYTNLCRCSDSFVIVGWNVPQL